MYPHGDFDNKEALLSLVGSFWANTYEGRDLVASYLFARAQEEKQSLESLKEVIASTAPSTCPIFLTDRIYPLKIRLSEKNKNKSNIITFDSSVDFGAQSDTGIIYEFDNAFFNNKNAVYSIPNNLVKASVITNRLISPSVTWVNGVDYAFRPKDNSIIFKIDPFDTQLFNVDEIYSNQVVEDYELTLWLFDAKFDVENLYYQYGYVLGPRLKSSQQYRRLIEWTLKAFNEGTSGKIVARLLAAITGISITENEKEVIEFIHKDTNKITVVTDKTVYNFEGEDVELVEVNDEITLDTPITAGLQVFELNRGIVPESLDRLTIGRGFLGNGYKEGLTFVNEELPTTVTTDSEGITEIRFPVYGFGADVEKFWNTVHERGKSEGKTLARYLDLRDGEHEDEPTASSLPAKINPLKFVVENFLRFNTFLIKINVEACNSLLGLSTLKILRSVLPPWTAAMVLFEATINDNPLKLANTPSSVETIYSNTIDETYDLGAVGESLVAKYSKGICLE